MKTTALNRLLPMHEPFFSTSTDCLIGSIPASCEPSTEAWFCSHALMLTVSAEGLGVQNSGWRALPFLTLAETVQAPDRGNAIHALLENGFFVAFCGKTEGERPAAGLICGISYGRFAVFFSQPDGTVGQCFLPYSAFGSVQTLRGLRVRRGAYRFDAFAAREALCRYLVSWERAEAILCLRDAPSETAYLRARRTLAEQRRAVAGALCRLAPYGGAAEDYRRKVLLPTRDTSVELAATWRAEEEILCRLADSAGAAWR